VSTPAASLHPLDDAPALPRLRALWLAAGLAAAFLLRLVLVWQRATPNYFPDEYLYAALGRSLGAFHGATVRGHAAHFPALLEPLLTAAAWRAGGVETGYRIVQALNAAALTVAAVPAYLLARRLGLSQLVALSAATLALVVPDALYASLVVAEPFAYPLVLGAAAAAVVALAWPSRRSQTLFLVLATLATLARVQFAILPLCYVGAALAVGLRERSLRRIVREQRLVGAALALAVAAAVAAGPHRVVGYYASVLHLHARPLGVAESLGSNLTVLLYTAGWILVPGAALGIVLAVWRPRSRVELAFATFTAILGAALLAQAALFGDSLMVQERYVFYVVPLAPIAFGLYASRGWPLRPVHALVAVALIGLSARLPLSRWAQPGADDHSPFLLAVQQLERTFGGNFQGAAAVAGAAALLALAAVAASFRPQYGAAVVLALALVGPAAMFGCAWEFDRNNSEHVLHRYLPSNPSWVDAAHVGPATLLMAPGGHTTAAEEQLFWNRSLEHVAVLEAGLRPDRLYADGAGITPDGTVVVAGRPLRGPVVVDAYATTIVFRGARERARAPQFRLYVTRRAQISAVMPGRYWDGMLQPGGGVMLWPAHPHARLAGWLELDLRAPRFGSLRLTLARRTVTAPAGTRTEIRVPVCSNGRWSAPYKGEVRDLVGGRPVAGWSSAPRFVPDARACPVDGVTA
jgi:hypothetical protein